MDGLVYAWATVDRNGARAAATAADERIARRTRRSALDGVPIGIKDLIDTADLRTTYGSPLFVDHVPVRDAQSALRDARAVIVGKTVTTEFATFDPPATRNPWNLGHTPGGSSSGSAAAVASSMVPGAIGSQTGGSTIRPASYCGVVGYVPSPGWVGRTGVYACSWALDRVGLFGTSVGEVNLLLNGCIGEDRDDPISRPVRRRPKRSHLPRRAAIVSSLVEQATPPMRRAVASVADLLASAGTRVEPIDSDEIELAHAAHMTVMRAEIASVHNDQYARHTEAYGSHVTELIESGRRVAAIDYLRALRYRYRFRREFADTTQGYDVLLAPAAVGAAEATFETIGQPLMNLLATFAGLPAIALPTALDDAGLPLGVQLIGRQDGDEHLLAMAAAVEERLAFRHPQLPILRKGAPSPD